MYTEEKEAAILTILSDAMDRIESLERELAEVKNQQKGEELLKALPQGHESGLDADKLDGKHLAEVLKKADQQTHDLVRRLERKFGSVALSVHGNELHNPHYEQYGLSLLLDGSRAMTGNLDMVSNAVVFDNVRVYAVGTTLYLRRHSDGQNVITCNWYRFDAMVQNCYEWRGYLDDSRIQTRQAATGSIKFRSYNGAAWQDEMQIINHSIRMANLPAADPADGTFTLWMNPADRTLRVGT